MDEPLRLVTGSPEGETPAVAGSSSFEAFFHDEARTLFRRLCTVTGNSSEAEEIMRDAFLALWERWDRISGMDDPTGYLYRTAMNVFRKRTRRASLAIRLTFASAPDPTPFSEIDARQDLQAARVLRSRSASSFVTLPPNAQISGRRTILDRQQRSSSLEGSCMWTRTRDGPRGDVRTVQTVS